MLGIMLLLDATRRDRKEGQRLRTLKEQEENSRCRKKPSIQQPDGWNGNELQSLEGIIKCRLGCLIGWSVHARCSMITPG